MNPKTLDHVAFWVVDREPIVEFATKHLGMHMIDRQEAFTLIGSDALRGKLTLFTAEGPREQGALKHVALYSLDPAATAEEYERFGFASAEPSPQGQPRVEVGGAYIEFHSGDPGSPEKPLLNHVAVLVDSVDEHVAEAEDMGVVDNVVDAANTRAVFVWGPERVRIEYVEHKPEFALT